MKGLLFIPISLATILATGCTQRDATTPSIEQPRVFNPVYPGKQSHLVFAARWEGQRIYWLDNDRVFVPGYAPRDVPRDTNGRTIGQVPLKLYIWDTRTNTHVAHADLGRGYSFCYQEGFISYTTRTEDNQRTRYQMAGMFPNEIPLAANADPMLDLSGNCPPPNRKNQGVFRAEHGYLATRNLQEDASSYDNPLYFFSPKNIKPIKLPVLRKEMGLGSSVSYAEWAQKYVLVPGTEKTHQNQNVVTSWPKGLPHPVYILSLTGKVETRHIPHGTWQPRGAYLTRAGLFWFSTDAPSTNSREAGGWVLNSNGEIGKLFSHLTNAVGVSPDGCKIAYANNDFNPETTEYVWVINVCK